MSPAHPDAYTIRRFRPEDAPGIVACVRDVYGEAYCIHPELYQPEEMVRLNASGELISVVALDPQGRVVGHYALERPGLSRVAESGEAMVCPDHRHHGLLERMRVLLEEEAQRLGLCAIFGRCVTTHVFSQAAVERFGERPCGLSLGRSPSTFHTAGQTRRQRVSTVMYMKYLQERDRLPLHAPAEYHEVIGRIYGQLRVEATFAEPAAPPPGPGTPQVELRQDLQRAVVRVPRVEAGSAAAVAQLRQDLCAGGKAEVVYLELPLGQPATPALAAAAAAEGFFFSGVAPDFFPDGDALRLQYLTVELDLSELELFNPFARDLLAFVTGDRRKVTPAECEQGQLAKPESQEQPERERGNPKG